MEGERVFQLSVLAYYAVLVVGVVAIGIGITQDIQRMTGLGLLLLVGAFIGLYASAATKG